MAKRECLKGALDDISKQVAKLEAAKASEAKLSELVKAAEKEEVLYRKNYGDLRKRWNEHAKTVAHIQCHLEQCYGDDLRTKAKAAICELVIDLREDKKALDEKVCGPQKELNQATDLLKSAVSQLDAWKTISKWIQDRLDENQKLIDEIRTLDSQQDPLFNLYIFCFELLPAHKLLEQSPEGIPLAERDPEAACKDGCGDRAQPKDDLIGTPWLIDPDGYDCKLAEVWEVWKKAIGSRATAEAAVKKHAKDLEDYATKSSRTAKREKARTTLKGLYEQEGPCREEKLTHQQTAQTV